MLATKLANLHAAIAVVCPIQGVAIDRVDFDSSATPEQRAAAFGVLASFDTLDPTQDDYATAIQMHVDAISKSKGYADGVALAGYSTSTIPSWASEAATFIAWRDQVWLHAYTELAKVQAGQRTAPTVESFLAELPAIGWPT